MNYSHIDVAYGMPIDYHSVDVFDIISQRCQSKRLAHYINTHWLGIL